MTVLFYFSFVLFFLLFFFGRMKCSCEDFFFPFVVSTDYKKRQEKKNVFTVNCLLMSGSDQSPSKPLSKYMFSGKLA